MGLPYGRQYTMEWPALHRGRGGRRGWVSGATIWAPVHHGVARPAQGERRAEGRWHGLRHLPPRSHQSNKMLVLQPPRPAGGTSLSRIASFTSPLPDARVTAAPPGGWDTPLMNPLSHPPSPPHLANTFA